MKGSVRLTMILSTAFILLSCATAPKYVPFSYTGTKLIYPAVREAVYTVIKNAAFDKIDIFANKFLVKDIVALDGPNQRKFDLDIDTSGGQISYEVKNAKLYMSKTNDWVDNDVFIFFHPNTLYSQLNKVIAPILSDDAKYEASKKAALSDLVFVYYSLKDMNAVSIKDFLKNELSSVVAKVTGEVVEVEESPKTIEGVDYKYRVFFTQSINKLVNKNSIWSSYMDSINFSMYTNDASVIRFNRGANIAADVKIVDTDRGTIGGFTMRVVQVN